MTRPLPCTRPSRLAQAGHCGGFALGSLAGDEGGAAAQTGSALHLAVAAWHQGLGELAMEHALQSMAKLPLADWGEASTWMLAYRADPRNAHDVCEHVELPVTVTIDGIRVEGTADQIRRQPGGELAVWDLKTGRGPGLELLNVAAVQLSAYAVAATATLGRAVVPGGVIRARDYDTGGPVFWSASWSLAGARLFVNSALADLRDLARGEVRLRPGRHCAWCPQGGPGVCSDESRPLRGAILA